jgi:hypothetical protein
VAFEEALASWEALADLAEQAAGLVEGLDDAVAAIEGPLSSDDPDVVEGLDNDLLGFGDDFGGSEVLLYEAEVGFVTDASVGPSGDPDYIYFGDQYSFVELGADDEIGDNLGSVSGLEIFAEETDTGVTLYIENVATAGNGTGTADMTIVTLNDVALEDLSFNDVTGILSGADILNDQSFVV